MSGFLLRSLFSATACISFERTDEIKTYPCGRVKGSHIRLQHKQVSRKHCVFMVSSDSIQVMDLQSSSGTFINGYEIKPNCPMDLTENDIIGIACKKICVQDLCRYNYVYRVEKQKIKKEKPDDQVDCVYDSSIGPSDSGEKCYTFEKIDFADDDVTVKPAQDSFQPVDNNLTAIVVKEEQLTASRTINERSKRPRKSTEDLYYDGDNKKLETSPTTKFNLETKDTNKIVKKESQQANFTANLDKKEKSIAKITSKRRSTDETNKNNKQVKKNKHADKDQKNQEDSSHVGAPVQFCTASNTQVYKQKDSSSYSHQKILAEEETINSPQETITQKPTVTTKNSVSKMQAVNTSQCGLNENNEPKKSIEKQHRKPNQSSSEVYNDNLRIRIDQNVSPREPSSPKKHNSNSYALKHTTKKDKITKLPNDFLLSICKWQPDRFFSGKFSPFISKLPDYLTSFTSFGVHYHFMSKFISLELWAYLLNQFDKHNPILLVAINNKLSIIRVHKDDILTEFTVEMLCSNGQMNSYPKAEDLVVISNEEIKFEPMFAYIKDMKKTYLTKDTIFNKCLINTVPNPSILITYTVIVKSLPSNLMHEELQKLQLIGNIGYFLRLVKATLDLKFSPLQSAIVNPQANKEVFSLSTVSNYKSYKFITGDQLSDIQKQSILQITNTVIKNYPKICVIDGPPGTGKTQMIVNIATEMIYGNNRMKKKELKRILICSHSDAAIDEITMRLLNVRDKVKVKGSQQPFRIVRAGPSELMHPGVVNITISELLGKISTPSTEIIESFKQEIKLCEDKIKKITVLINSQRTMPENERSTLQKKYEYYVAKARSLKKRDRHSISVEENKFSREKEILTSAHIVTCTLSWCFTHEMKTSFNGITQISTCIIDEASISNEPESLLPLRLGVKQLILVGDSNQLPLSTYSEVAKANNYNKSLFTRLNDLFDLDEKSPIITLSRKY